MQRVLRLGAPSDTKTQRIAHEGSETAQSGTFDAAAFGEVVPYTVRDVLSSRLLRRPASLTGKVVLDCNNSAICGLVEELGFVAVDSGELARAQLVESLADFVRLHILGGYGPYATISLHVLAERDSPQRVDSVQVANDRRVPSLTAPITAGLWRT